MKKKLVAVLMASAMVCSMGTVSAVSVFAEEKTEEAAETKDEEAKEEKADETKAEDDKKAEEEEKVEETPAADAEAPAADAVKLPVEPEFEPNRDGYDKYTAFDYEIEDIGAEMVVTLSATEDESKIDIQCNFYGDDQHVVAEKDGDGWKILEDKTGFMETDTPLMIAKAQEQNIWLPTDETKAAAAGDAAAATELPVEPEFEPNAEYDKYTAIDYEIEDIGAEMVVTISAMEDESKVDIQCNFYGDDQHVVAEKDGEGWKILEDKTGFMETDTPLMMEKAQEQNIWLPIEK
jgi:hypothetical protein